MDGVDLRRAVLEGLLLLAVDGVGEARIVGRVLMFDPSQPDRERGIAVMRLLRDRKSSERHV